MTRISLDDLIHPLSTKEFLAGHWDRGQPMLGNTNGTVIQRFVEHPHLRNLESLLPRLCQDVLLFGPNGARTPVSPAVALDFLRAGNNVYVRDVDKALPDTALMFADVAAAIGVSPSQVHVEAFAGEPGGVSSRHFDHDVNFQILLAGEKVWKLEHNAVIENPLYAYHPIRTSADSLSGLDEEAHAAAELPHHFSANAIDVLARSGTCLFLPRGYWHEVTSLTATWSVNLVIRGRTWAQALAQALVDRLHRAPEFRAYCQGVKYSGHEETSVIDLEERFSRLRGLAVEALMSIGRVEAFLAGEGGRFRWTARAGSLRLESEGGTHRLVAPQVIEDDALELDDDTMSAVTAMMRFHGTFSWADIQTVNPVHGTIELWNLVAVLLELKLIERVQTS